MLDWQIPKLRRRRMKLRRRARAKERAESRRLLKELEVHDEVVLALGKAAPCTDCGGVFPPRAMDFHHLKNKGRKLFNISRAYSRSDAAILAELKKCILLCSNCHRLREQAEIEHQEGLRTSRRERIRIINECRGRTYEERLTHQRAKKQEGLLHF